MATVLRDAVHGDIELDASEVFVLDTRAVQRLRGVKQLGTASLVYPSAVHTRFEHALGTLHLAGRIAAALPDGALSPRDVRVARLAGLLHDVTHIPFGHTFEDERRVFPRHDTPERTRRFLHADGLPEALEATGLAREVEEALCGPAGLIADVVRGTVGADLLDYVRRDALFTGLRLLGYDERIFRYLTRREDGAGRVRLALRIDKRGALRADAVSEVLNLLWLRYTLCERVYFHHAKIASGAMVSRAVEHAVDEGLRLEELFSLRDDGLFAHLRARFPGHRAIAALLDGFERRALFKRAFVLTPEVGEAAQAALVGRYHADAAARAALEADLARAAGLDPTDVIVYCPEPRMAHKEADIPVVLGDGPARPLRDLGLPEVDLLLDKHRRLWRFYVLVSPEALARRDALASACAERLTAPGSGEAAEARVSAGNRSDMS